MNKTLMIVLALIVVIALSAIGFYNGMLSADEGLQSLQAQVDNMYERRVDLLPQMTAVVKKYAEYESGTLANIVGLREGAGNLQKLESMAAAGEVKSPEFSNLLASTMSTIKLTMEAYPELKADTQFTALMTEIEGSENRIRTAIKDYNDRVAGYNLQARSFPRGFFFGRIFGFTAKDRITPPAEKAIKAVPDIENLLK